MDQPRRHIICWTAHLQDALKILGRQRKLRAPLQHVSQVVQRLDVGWIQLQILPLHGCNPILDLTLLDELPHSHAQVERVRGRGYAHLAALLQAEQEVPRRYTPLLHGELVQSGQRLVGWGIDSQIVQALAHEVDREARAEVLPQLVVVLHRDVEHHGVFGAVAVVLAVGLGVAVHDGQEQGRVGPGQPPQHREVVRLVPAPEGVLVHRVVPDEADRLPGRGQHQRVVDVELDGRAGRRERPVLPHLGERLAGRGDGRGRYVHTDHFGEAPLLGHPQNVHPAAAAELQRDAAGREAAGPLLVEPPQVRGRVRDAPLPVAPLGVRDLPEVVRPLRRPHVAVVGDGEEQCRRGLLLGLACGCAVGKRRGGAQLRSVRARRLRRARDLACRCLPGAARGLAGAGAMHPGLPLQELDEVPVGVALGDELCRIVEWSHAIRSHRVRGRTVRYEQPRRGTVPEFRSDVQGLNSRGVDLRTDRGVVLQQQLQRRDIATPGRKVYRLVALHPGLEQLAAHRDTDVNAVRQEHLHCRPLPQVCRALQWPQAFEAIHLLDVSPDTQEQVCHLRMPRFRGEVQRLGPLLRGPHRALVLQEQPRDCQVTI
mmetsp:Transcript_5205/g.14720  ORF Transcript_5205/g.14720 Transcript_5205/m.14720 type:complete len:598 (-) Transcript_5205:807-2600(-)